MLNHSRAAKSAARNRRDALTGNEDINAPFIAGRKLALVSRSDFVARGVRPGVAAPAAETDDPKPSPWSTVFASLMEGFVLYGASLHPSTTFPIEFLRTDRDISAAASPWKAALPLENGAGRNVLRSIDVVSAGAVRRSARRARGFAAGLWMRWRRERQIKKAISALAELDDRILRDMGISCRSEIEQVVRYCRDC